MSVQFQPDAMGLYHIAVGSDGDDRTGVYRISVTEEELARNIVESGTTAGVGKGGGIDDR